MFEVLRGGWTPSDEDALIAGVADEARMLDEILKERDRTRMSWVTLPEPMAIAETAEAIRGLQQRGITVNEIIVNRLAPPAPGRCGHCKARRAFERRAVSQLPPLRRLTVEARDSEPLGVGALARIGRELHAAPVKIGKVPASRVWSASLRGKRADPGSLITGDIRLLLFGGKGGVGKTTCAAAVAVAAAREMKGSRVLLISTDPAHSLADGLGSPVTDRAAVVRGGPPNLLVREMDSAAVFETIRGRYAAAIDSMFDRLAGTESVDLGYDRTVMRGLIDLAPPGLDELAAIIEITDALSPASYDLVVVDTAPTGHALRVLEMPELLQTWTRALMAILL
jgi:arsenite-transporting ATPase